MPTANERRKTLEEDAERARTQSDSQLLADHKFFLFRCSELSEITRAELARRGLLHSFEDHPLSGVR